MSPTTNHQPSTTPRVLIIAGSDSGGGAGIQADIKTVTMLGGYAATAITALTAQNTLGVFGVHDIPEAFIQQQIDLVLNDIGADVIKTGMLHKTSIIELVADTVAKHKIPLVLDPVMVAKGGAPLLEQNAITTLKTKLLPLATIVTPNIPEAELLSGITISTVENMEKAAVAIQHMGVRAVLIKGGHMEGNTLTDLLLTGTNFLRFESPRINSKNTHGTGCTLASAIATRIAQKMTLKESVTRARDYVRYAIQTAPGLGRGHGPLNHAHPLSSCSLTKGS